MEVGAVSNNPTNFKRFIKHHKHGESMDGEILHIAPNIGIFVGFEMGVSGLIFKNSLPRNFDVSDKYQVGKRVKVKIQSFRHDRYQLRLELVSNIVEEQWENIVELYTQVMDINIEQGLVQLNCKYEINSEETFEKVFPLKHFSNRETLEVDASVIVKVLEKPGEVRFLFEQSKDNFFDEDSDESSMDHLQDSPIFKPL